MKFTLLLIASYSLVAVALIVLATKVAFPNHRLIALVIYLISWAPFLLGIREKRASIEQAVGFFSAYWTSLLLFIVLLLFVYVIVVLFPVNSGLKDIPAEDLRAHINGDAQVVRYLSDDVDRLIGELDGSMDGAAVVEQAEAVMSVWGELLEHLATIDLIKGKYAGFAHINVLKESELHADAFLLAYAAFMVEQSSVQEIVGTVGDNTHLITLLNEGTESTPVPEQSYSDLKLKLTSSDELVRLNAGRLYFELIKTKSSQDDLASLIESSLGRIDSSLDQYPKLLAENPLEFLERSSFEAWFPIQKQVAISLSYVSVATRDYLIKPEHLEPHIDKFFPGDIFVERREWNATNVGIPGYWTHAALYLGTLEEMDEYFGDSFSNFVAEKYPEVFAEFQEKDDHGFPLRVIEAKRPGVILTSLEYSGGGDALGVLRVADLSKDKRKAVVMNALSHFGKSYDFNFDFTTDTTVVCSELIYRAYLDNGAADFELEQLNGRLLYAPNSFVSKFDDEFESDSTQLEFVLFLDGNESTKEIVVRDASEFRDSWNRPKWHIVKDHIPELL